MVLQVVGHPGSAVPVVDGEEGELRVRLQVGEGRAPVLVRLFVSLKAAGQGELKATV